MVNAVVVPWMLSLFFLLLPLLFFVDAVTVVATVAAAAAHTDITLQTNFYTVERKKKNDRVNCLGGLV